jgi:hypothetical protein
MLHHTAAPAELRYRPARMVYARWRAIPIKPHPDWDPPIPGQKRGPLVRVWYRPLAAGNMAALKSRMNWIDAANRRVKRK